MAASTQPNQTVNDLNWTFALVGIADATMLPYIPLYLAQRGMSAGLIGLVLACAALATFVVGLGWAYLADRRFSPERMVVAAAVAAADGLLERASC
jgi:cyanate permease